MCVSKKEVKKNTEIILHLKVTFQSIPTAKSPTFTSAYKYSHLEPSEPGFSFVL